ncbi:MAG: glutathione S-transferase family protein [Polyangiaceae bacterium]
MLVLIHLSVSPWSEKARWALDHHGVAYRAIEHVPMVFEPALRLAARDVRTKVTVPMLIDGRMVFRDSLAIARHADVVGRGAPLFPADALPEILEWDARAESVMRAGRARAMERLLASDEALMESTPPPLRALGGAARAAARMGANFIVGKHHTRGGSPAEHEAAMVRGLELLAQATSRGDYLVGDRFTFADLAMACALGFVEPHARAHMGPATRAAFSEPRLAAAFPALLAWRDRIVDRHR